MATKSTETGEPATTQKPAAKTVAVAKFVDPPDKPKAEALAKMALRPSVNAAAVVIEYTKPFGEQDIGALVDTLADEVEKLENGDLARCEAMLYGQAHALQAIFMNLARRAAMQEHMKHWEAFLRMALKAQNQCRMTLETLATIKNPPVVFVRQANIAHGPQQVNNAPAPGPLAHAAKTDSAATELLEANHGERLDTRATDATGGADPRVDAVGAVHRAAHR